MKLLEFGEKLHPLYIWNHFSGPELIWGIFMIGVFLLFFRGIFVSNEFYRTESVIYFFSNPLTLSLFIFWTCSIFIFDSQNFLDFIFEKNNPSLNAWKVSMMLWIMLLIGYLIGRKLTYLEPTEKMKKWADELTEKEKKLKNDLINYDKRDETLLVENKNLKNKNWNIEQENKNLKEQISKLEESKHVVIIKPSKKGDGEGGFNF